MQSSDYATIKQAIAATGKSDATIRRAIKSGKLKAEKINGEYQISNKSLKKLWGIDLHSHDKADDKADDGTSQTMHELVNLLKQELVIKNEQIRSQSEQIKTLTEALRAQQLLTLELAKQLPTLEAKDQPIEVEAQPKVEPSLSPPEPKKQQGWWGRVRNRWGR